MSRARAAWVWLGRRAENVLALMMAAMFVAFVLQVVFRYVLNLPVAWTEEVCVIAWVWGILWGAAFVSRNTEEIRFDMVYGMVPRRAKRAFTATASTAIVVIMLISLPAALSYVRFMKVESTASLGIRLDLLFSIYIAFVLSTLARHGKVAYDAIRDRLVEDTPADRPPVDL